MWVWHLEVHRTLVLLDRVFCLLNSEMIAKNALRPLSAKRQVQKKPTWLRVPLSVPTKQLENVSLDFILSLSKKLWSILILVPKVCNIYCNFHPLSTLEATNLWWDKYIVKYWSVSKNTPTFEIQDFLQNSGHIFSCYWGWDYASS